jgi:CheY-like chemotaxis protein
VTGYGQPDDVRRSREAGFDVHLVKPVDADRLSTLLDRLAARDRG